MSFMKPVNLPGMPDGEKAIVAKFSVGKSANDDQIPVAIVDVVVAFTATGHNIWKMRAELEQEIQAAVTRFAERHNFPIYGRSSKERTQ